MIACLDVDYRGDHAVAAAVCFDGWTATASIQEVVAKVAPIAPYVPGRFFERVDNRSNRSYLSPFAGFMLLL